MTSSPAHPSPDAPTDADEATVWRVCQAQRDDLVCKRCPRWEDSHRGKVQRGCFAVANELVNIVQTGNPWRKTQLNARAERSGWVVLPAFLEAQSAPSTGVQPRPSREDVADGWRPIESAPTDGTPVWAYQPNGTPQGAQFIAWMDDHIDCGLCWFDEQDSEPEPTHWRPLPPPPEGELSGKPADKGGEE